MEIRHHSRSEEKLLKSLLKKEELESIEQHLSEKTKNEMREKQNDFLKYLLLTGNELDLKKILCLHLFAITVPPNACKRDPIAMKIDEFTNYAFFLPNYYLHNDNQDQLYCPCWEDENKMKIGKLRSYSTHLAVNVSIVNVLKTVLKVLSTLDLNILKKLVAMSHNMHFIHSLLKNDHYKIYINRLRDAGVFHNRNKLRTEECTIIRATSRLVSEVAHIKKNMVFTIVIPNPSLAKMIPEATTSEGRKKTVVDVRKSNDPVNQNFNMFLNSIHPALRSLNLKNMPIFDKEGNVDYNKMVACISYIVNHKLYEDNHKIKEFTKYSFILPNYFIHDSEEGELYCKCWYNENKEKIGKFRPCKIHLAINISIVGIIETIIEVLNKFNKFSFEKLVNLSHNLSVIQSCLAEKEYIEYIASLHNLGVFSQVKMLRTEVCTIIKATQKLTEIAHIRKNMVLSLRVPDLMPTLSNLFPKQSGNGSAIGYYIIDIIKRSGNSSAKITPFSLTEDSIKDFKNNNYCATLVAKPSSELTLKTGTRVVKKYPKKLVHFHNHSVRRWPYTESEININKELEQIKRINEKYLKKYITSNENEEIKVKRHLPAFGFENHQTNLKRIHKAEKVAKLKTLNNTVKMGTKNLPPSHKSLMDFIKDTTYKHQSVFCPKNGVIFSNKTPFRNKTTFSQSKLQNLNKEEIINVSEKISLESIDKNELKNGLLKVELRSKLYKLISSVDNSLIEN